MSGEPQVSVIACVYNAEKTFGATLDCLFGSEWKVPFEVIVVDDASTDSTRELCGRYDTKVIALKENVGPARARNVGIEESSGAILLFVDSDVLFPPDLIGRMLKAMEADPALSGVGSISSPTPLNPGFYSRYFALQEYLILSESRKLRGTPQAVGICTRLGTMRREVFEVLGGFNEAIRDPSVEDGEFSLRMRGKYFVDWPEDFENEHYFPDSLGKIWRRYHLNTKEYAWALRRLGIKDTSAFQEDTRARFLLGLAGIFLLISMWTPWALVGVAVLICGAVFVKRKLFGLLLGEEDAMFCVKGALVYAVTSVPIASGLVASLIYPAPQPKG